MALHSDQTSDQVRGRDPVLRRCFVGILLGEHGSDVAEQHLALGAVFLALDLTTQRGGLARPLRPVAAGGLSNGQKRAPIVRVAVEEALGRLRIGGLNLLNVVERPARRLEREVVESGGAVEAEAVDLLAA